TDRYLAPAPIRLRSTRDRALFATAGGACALFVLAIPFVGDHIGYAALAAAVLAIAGFAVFDRSALRPSLIPWQLLIFVIGLFLVIPTLGRYGLSDLMAALIGTDSGTAGAYRAAGAGLGLSNIVNNLPAYTAGEAVIPPDHRNQLLSLLIGTNVGAIATPWASLATLLCLEFCRSHAVPVPPVRFVCTGLALAVIATAGAVGGVLLTG
ncbi:arsenic transporter, partial [Nocardia nova]